MKAATNEMTAADSRKNKVNRREREQQFSEWVEQHYGLFVHVAKGFAAESNREDLLQEILLATWHALPAFRGDSSPATFLYRVAQNAALTWCRPQRRQPVAETLDDDEHAAPLPDTKPARTEAMYTAIRELPSADRTLVLLYLDESSYREISAITGMSESNIGVRLNRIRRQLAALLKETDI